MTKPKLFSISTYDAARRNLLDRRWSNLSPNQLLIILAILIFVAEVCDMLLINMLPPLNPWAEALLDSCLLLLILSPAYFLLYRPFWQAHQQATKEVRTLSRELIRAEESSRKALARDLHDEFGQVLGALQLGIETVKTSLPAKQERLIQQCNRLSHMTAQLGTHLRDVTTELRPDILDSFGLVPALRWQLKQFRLRHPEVEVIMNLPEQKAGVSPEASLVLYRVCQESLVNVAKHAQAKQVVVELKMNNGQVILKIEDDGVGCEPDGFYLLDDECPRGIGIIGMRERVADGGGSMSIFSLPGAGTTVVASLPAGPGADL